MREETTASNNDRLFQILSILIVILMYGLSLWAYPHLPARVPLHWNAAGQVNGYGSAFSGAFLMPTIALGIWILFLLIPRIDPRRANFRQMSKVFWLFNFVVILFLGLLHTGTLMVALGALRTSIIPIFASVGTGLLFIVLGNYMGKVKFNYTFGVRTPWTLANEEVWYKTHRAVGPIWVIGGVFLVFAGFLPKSLTAPVITVVVLALALGSMAYSYVAYQKITRR